MNHPFTDSDIINYIRGNMSGDERDQFEKELESNADLTNELKNTRLSIAAIDRRGEEMLKQRFKKLESRSTIKKWVSVLFIALSLVALGFIIKKVFTKEQSLDMKAIYADNFEKYRSPVTIRNNEDRNADMSDAIKAYSENDYGKAFDLFNIRCDDINQEACFYAVLSSLYDEKIEYLRAKSLLKQDSPYLSIVLWNEGLFYLHIYSKNDALGYFDALIERGDYKKSEAMEIVSQLRGVD